MRLLIKLTLVFVLIFSGFNAFSQCAMCSRVAESSRHENKDSADGLNTGIIYLLSVPYILGGIGVFVWYRSRKKAE
jgi:hypothetical protein